MQFGYTIIYVDDVEATLEFYCRAFGLEIRFLDDSKDYGELATGATVLAFAAHRLGESNLDQDYVHTDPDAKPLGVEIVFVDDDVAAAYETAIAAGAVSIKAPEAKPWGQIVGYVRAIDGSVIELATPIPG